MRFAFSLLADVGWLRSMPGTGAEKGLGSDAPFAI